MPEKGYDPPYIWARTDSVVRIRWKAWRFGLSIVANLHRAGNSQVGWSRIPRIVTPKLKSYSRFLLETICNKNKLSSD